MNIPVHVAIICDGNRRWAKEKGLATFAGHKRGYERAVEIGKKARELGIRILTFWIFSTENWNRSLDEVGYLMNLFESMIEQNLKDALKNEIRIIHLGRKDRLRKSLLNKIVRTEKETCRFTKYYSVFALDYGGRDEIIRALHEISNNQFPISEFNDKAMDNFLDTRDLPQPDVDLVIRTSGEQRTSGLMIWQAAYAEYIFINKHFPDFTPGDFEKCIEEYSQRHRRFGK